MSIVQEFKEFAIKGNAVDLAVGLIVGASFGKIVDSLVNDIIMPPIGLILGKVDFSNLFITLRSGKDGGDYATLADAAKAGAVTLNYGLFINVIVSFIIVAMATFMLIRGINKLKRGEEPKAKGPSEEVQLLAEIRDVLKSK